jgi:hypothetical protein
MTPTSFIEKTNRHKRHRVHFKALMTRITSLLESFGWRFVPGSKSSVFLAVALVAGGGGENRWTATSP